MSSASVSAAARGDLGDHLVQTHATTGRKGDVLAEIVKGVEGQDRCL